MGCWVELGQPAEGVGLREWDGSWRWSMRLVEAGSMARWRVKLETRPGQAVEPETHRSEDRPLHAERIRRPWEAVKCAAMGPVVGRGEVASGEWRVTSDNSRAFGRVVWLGRDGEPETHRSEDRPLHGEPDPGAVRVRGRAGSGRRGCR